LPRAWSLIRPAPWYRHEAFAAGLRAVGYDVVHGEPTDPRPGDALVVWNRYGHAHAVASRFEAAGGTVLCAENGYIGHGGSEPKFDVHPGGPKPTDYYALAVGWHNGRGRWLYGGPERFAAIGVELRPWRKTGEHILVCPNRSFGVGKQVMPQDWADKAAARLQKSTARPVVIRRHPGNDRPERPLSADLENAWAVVIWSSGAGVHALARGIPVYVEAPYWIMKNASASGPVDDPRLPDPMTVLANLERLAWAQWELREIERGEPFGHLLRAGVEAKVG
jgi:hypothetical protein